MSDQVVDPLAIGAPPEPGVVVVPDPAPPADPLAGLHFEVNAHALKCPGCQRTVHPGERVFRLPATGRQVCEGCARVVANPGTRARRERYRQETGRDLAVWHRLAADIEAGA